MQSPQNPQAPCSPDARTEGMEHTPEHNMEQLLRIAQFFSHQDAALQNSIEHINQTSLTDMCLQTVNNNALSLSAFSVVPEQPNPILLSYFQHYTSLKMSARILQFWYTASVYAKHPILYKDRCWRDLASSYKKIRWIAEHQHLHACYQKTKPLGMSKILKTLPKQWTPEEYEQLQDLVYLLQNFDLYVGLLRKRYSYVWEPTAFLEFFDTLIVNIKKQLQTLQVPVFFSLFEQFLKHIECWCMSLNLILYVNYAPDFIEPSFYVQPHYPCIDHALMQALYFEHVHQGLYATGTRTKLKELKNTYLTTKYAHPVLEKVTWDGKNALSLTLFFFDGRQISLKSYGLFLSFLSTPSSGLIVTFEDFLNSLDLDAIEITMHLKKRFYSPQELHNFFIFALPSDHIQYLIPTDIEGFYYRLAFYRDAVELYSHSTSCSQVQGMRLSWYNFLTLYTDLSLTLGID